MDDFVLRQNLLSSNNLFFSLHKGPVEDISEALFSACGQIIGKEITVVLQTESLESVSLNAESDSTADINFKGVIISASGSRSGSSYSVQVEAKSWDTLLEDNPSCRSYENQTLNNIVCDVIDDYTGHLDSDVDSRYTDTIPYCVQYNETHFQFLRRLASRYGEWLYNDGTNLVFGNLKKQDTVRLRYPSQDIPSYHVKMQMHHVAFNQVASSYNAFNSSQKDGLSEMRKAYNSLSDQVFDASQECFTKSTLQNLHSGGFADSDSRDIVLEVAAKTQGRGQKAGMLIYSGVTFCSKLKLGSILTIVDNYITDSAFNLKSEVEQDSILITGLVHQFSSDETYSNQFTGIPSECDYPPYSNSDIYPVAAPSRAKVMDNEDPNNLGRIRVQFDWQAQLDSEMMTPWLRIAHPYAGNGKGFSFIPEVGEEVMVDFEGGNAERPFITGTLFNGPECPDDAWLPGGNSDNPIKAIRTRNGHTIEIHDEGQDGFIRIYDNKKENYILTLSTDEKLIKLESTGNIELYAAKDILIHAGNDIIASADHDISHTADNDMFLAAHNDMQRTADNDIREHVGNDRNAAINNNDTLTVSANQFVKVEDNKDEVVTNKLQITADTIRIEAKNKLMEYSKTHHQKADNEMAMNAGSEIDIKASITKIN